MKIQEHLEMSDNLYKLRGVSLETSELINLIEENRETI